MGYTGWTGYTGAASVGPSGFTGPTGISAPTGPTGPGGIVSCATGGTYMANTGATVPTAGTLLYFMLGLGPNCHIKPLVTGNIFVSVTGFLTDTANVSSPSQDIAYGLVYGTGTAPVHGGGLTGVPFGNTMRFDIGYTFAAAADVKVPVALTGLVGGLAVGTTYWFDLRTRYFASAADPLVFTNVSTILVEIA